MHGIDITFVGLQIIAARENFSHGTVFRWHRKKLVRRQGWRISGSHVGKDDPASFSARICGLADGHAFFPTFHPVTGNNNFATRIKKPAVEDAADSVFFELAISHVEALMGAIASDQPRIAGTITK